LNDLTLGAIKEIVTTVNYSDLQQYGVENEVLAVIQQESEEYGIHIFKVTFADFGRVRSIRLITNEATTNE
jgi:hypothetical protein